MPCDWKKGKSGICFHCVQFATERNGLCRVHVITPASFEYAAVEPLKFMTKTSIKMFEGHGRKRKGYNNAY